MSGTRYYSINATTVATRTGASSVVYMAGDQQGTDSVAIDAQALNVTHRYYDPYGNPRGSTPSNFPTGQKGFVGGTADSATGLTNLGAREYQPGTGSFISPDSVIKPYQPWDLNPYAYAKDSPSTFSDPTGKDPCDGIRNQNLHRNCEIDQSRLQESQACTGGTAPGQGRYYTNDTPIGGPSQQWWGHQPYSVDGFWGQAKNFESDPAQMMQDDPMFKAQVQYWINTCKKRGQTVCNSGWQVSSLDDKNYKMTHSEQLLYYELGSWNYRVTGYKDTSGQWHFAVDVFEYYKWGNPYGGPAKADLCVPHIHFPCITQNSIAQLNADGTARNFDVWGTYDIPGGSG